MWETKKDLWLVASLRLILCWGYFLSSNNKILFEEMFLGQPLNLNLFLKPPVVSFFQVGLYLLIHRLNYFLAEFLSWLVQIVVNVLGLLFHLWSKKCNSLFVWERSLRFFLFINLLILISLLVCLFYSGANICKIKICTACV